MITPTVGQDVLFVLSDSTERPFKVIKAWGDDQHNMVDGILFLNGPNDSFAAGTRGELTVWKVSVYFDSLKRPNTWHYPESA